MSNTSARIIFLRDGRRLAFDDCGRPGGTPILYFHGNGQCRLGRHPDDGIAENLGVRLIAIDRPGSGRSTPQPGRRLADWGDDVEQLVDALEIPRFGVLGWSSGGPYAAACAHALPDRVASVSIVSGLAPIDHAGAADGMEHGARFLLRLAGLSPRAILGPLALMRGVAGLDASRLTSLLFAASPPCDHAILKQPEIRQMFVATYEEAVRGGARAMAYEVSLLPKPWGFRLEDVDSPVALYHGELDNLAPLPMGRYVHEHLPNATLRVFPGEGHQLIWPRWQELLGELAQNTRERIALMPGAQGP